MKKVVRAALILLPILGFSQFSTPKIFGEIGVFYEDEFEPKPHLYVKLSAGAELFSYKFIAPEVDVTFYTGGDEDERSEFDDQGISNYNSILHRNTNTVIWGFAPKLFYGDDEYRLVLIPKYNFGVVSAKGKFYDSDYIKTEKTAKADINFWSFALGIEGDGWSESTSFGFYLMYTGFNAGKALNELDFEDEGYSKSDYNTKAVGLSFRIAYNFKKKDQNSN